jgi:hypothetical protein
MRRIMLAFMSMGMICISTYADEPAKKQEPEKLPAPKLKVDPSIVIVPTYQRSDTRDVWQHYGVNAFGRFVPRVIVTPHGAYYSRTLDPYPWPYNRPSAIMPMAVD